MAARRLSQNNRYPLIAVVSPDAGVLRRVSDAIERLFGHRHAWAAPDADALESTLSAADAAPPDLLILDAPTTPDAEGALRRLSDHRADLPILILLREPSNAAAADLIERGAIDALLIDEPAWTLALAPTIERALVRAELRRRRDRTELELRRALARLEGRNKALEERISRLETMAWTDPLTGLANRRQVEERLPQLFAEAARYDSDLSCLMIDLDGLKPVNDTCGHAAGDDLLQLAARIVTEGVRASDIAGRVGGDEFVVLMPRTPDDTAAVVARRLADTFALRAARLIEREYDQNKACTRRIGMSVGVASLRGCQPLDGDSLIAAADAGVYEAKRRGTNRVIIRRGPNTYEEATSTTPGS
ncbi:MAG: GGDEF domain-containing protein [Phycisphaerales bacterium]